MNPQKIIDKWIKYGLPADLHWNQVDTLCRWLCKKYGFTFRQGGKKTHWILAHDLLSSHYAPMNTAY